MKSKIYLNGSLIEVSTFKGGEVQINLEQDLHINSGCHSVEAHLKCSNGIIALCQLMDVLNSCRFNIIDLQLPYVPYARYDRRMKKVDSQSLKVFANILNSLNFNKVTIDDPHSNVVENLIDRSVIIPQHKIVQLFDIDIKKYTHIVSPDQGASKKIKALSDMYNIPIIHCDKARDSSDMIASVLIHDEVPKDAVLLIVDDICDGGRTFIEVSKALKAKGALSVDLFVTHGIFSYGADVILDYIDNIHCKYSWIKSENINYSILF